MGKKFVEKNEVDQTRIQGILLLLVNIAAIEFTL